MMWSDYWGALRSRQRIGLIFGAMLIVIAMFGVSVWLLHDPYVPLATSLSHDQLLEVTQSLDRAKLQYRIGDDGDAVTVSQSQLGKARAATASGQFGVPPSVGLELFKETDFSSTDFAQKINYQRALQGELTRTIQTISGVRSARVHVILADGGVFKRNAAKASAAISLALQPGKLLTPLQVRGIQRLVTASVPEIKIDDVVVLDESGTSLTRAIGEADGELSSAQLDLKRQADQYLESKLARLLQELVPHGTVSLSVDTVLDERQLRVTTEEPLGAHSTKDVEHVTGVVVKERQSRRGHLPNLIPTGGDAVDADDMDHEYDYTVGRRVEQVLSAPGSIKRISVAVALQEAPADFSSAAIEQLVASAVGIDRSRGDSVAVLLMPNAGAIANARSSQATLEMPAKIGDDNRQKRIDPEDFLQQHGLALTVAVLLAAILLSVYWRFRLRAKTAAENEFADNKVDIDVMTAKVREWLKEGASNGHA